MKHEHLSVDQIRRALIENNEAALRTSEGCSTCMKSIEKYREITNGLKVQKDTIVQHSRFTPLAKSKAEFLTQMREGSSKSWLEKVLNKDYLKIALPVFATTVTLIVVNFSYTIFLEPIHRLEKHVVLTRQGFLMGSFKVETNQVYETYDRVALNQNIEVKGKFTMKGRKGYAKFFSSAIEFEAADFSIETKKNQNLRFGLNLLQVAPQTNVAVNQDLIMVLSGSIRTKNDLYKADSSRVLRIKPERIENMSLSDAMKSRIEKSLGIKLPSKNKKGSPDAMMTFEKEDQQKLDHENHLKKIFQK